MDFPLLSSNDWAVKGVENELASAYEIANWENTDNARYAVLTSGLTADQIYSLDATAEFLKELLESDAISEEYSGIVFQNTADDFSAKYKDGSDVVYIHYPKVWGFIKYISDTPEDGWYVLCGKADDDNEWMIGDYQSRLSGSVSYAISGDVSDLGDSTDTAMTSLILRKVYNGYKADGAPYLKFQTESRERWSIVGSDGENITGVAYNSFIEAASVAMRIYDFCGVGEWVNYRQTSGEPANTAKVGYALPGRAIVGTTST